MTHTCCRHDCANDISQWGKACLFSIPPQDQVEELHDEERELLALHQKLMDELTEAWLASILIPARFFLRILRPRIRQTKSEQSNTSEEEVTKMKSIGVKVEAGGVNVLHDTEDEYDNEAEDIPLVENDIQPESHNTNPSDKSNESAGLDTSAALANGITEAEQDQTPDHGDKQGQIEADEDYDGQTIEGIDDVEVAEILREAARVNGLDKYDVWFEMIGSPDPRITPISP